MAGVLALKRDQNPNLQAGVVVQWAESLLATVACCIGELVPAASLLAPSEITRKAQNDRSKYLASATHMGDLGGTFKALSFSLAHR